MVGWTAWVTFARFRCTFRVYRSGKRMPGSASKDCHDVRHLDRLGSGSHSGSLRSYGHMREREKLEAHTPTCSSLASPPCFLELACIRWFGSAVLFLTFFTNLVLFACFLGMSVGLLAASRRARPRDLDDPAGGRRRRSGRTHFVGLCPFREREHRCWRADVAAAGLLRDRAPARSDLSRFVVPIECVAAVFFAVIALMFVGLGQAMGRAFAAAPDRVSAYSVDILGSLAGIACFSLASYCQTSPVVWFAIGIGGSLPRLAERLPAAVLRPVGPDGPLATAATRDGGRFLTFWSPYYKVTYHPRSGMIETNHIGHQVIVDVRKDGPAYSLPHLLNRDAGGRPFR